MNRLENTKIGFLGNNPVLGLALGLTTDPCSDFQHDQRSGDGNPHLCTGTIGSGFRRTRQDGCTEGSAASREHPAGCISGENGRTSGSRLCTFSCIQCGDLPSAACREFTDSLCHRRFPAGSFLREGTGRCGQGWRSLLSLPFWWCPSCVKCWEQAA